MRIWGGAVSCRLGDAIFIGLVNGGSGFRTDCARDTMTSVSNAAWSSDPGCRPKGIKQPLNQTQW